MNRWLYLSAYFLCLALIASFMGYWVGRRSPNTTRELVISMPIAGVIAGFTGWSLHIGGLLNFVSAIVWFSSFGIASHFGRRAVGASVPDVETPGIPPGISPVMRRR